CCADRYGEPAKKNHACGQMVSCRPDYAAQLSRDRGGDRTQATLRRCARQQPLRVGPEARSGVRTAGGKRSAQAPSRPLCRFTVTLNNGNERAKRPGVGPGSKREVARDEEKAHRPVAGEVSGWSGLGNDWPRWLG